jgi:hypothetical protein
MEAFIAIYSRLKCVIAAFSRFLRLQAVFRSLTIFRLQFPVFTVPFQSDQLKVAVSGLSDFHDEGWLLSGCPWGYRRLG